MAEKGWFREHAAKTVVGAVIGVVVVALVPPVRDFLSSVPGHVGAFFGWLGELVQTARWVFWSLSLVVSVGGVVAVVAFVRSRAGPSETSYTSDTFLGFVWRWRWPYGRLLGPDDVVPYCPGCDRHIVLQNESRYGGDRFVHLICENCRTDEERPGTFDDVAEWVIREIDLKVRNGEWKDVVVKSSDVTRRRSA